MKVTYSDKTLMGMTKADLVRQIKDARHNQAAAEERLAQQAENVKDWRPVRWIPCSERLPEMFKNRLGIECSETVFALTTGRKIMAAYLRRVPGDKAIWIAPFNFWEAWDEKITHWMEFPPLPELPEEGTPEND